MEKKGRNNEPTITWSQTKIPSCPSSFLFRSPPNRLVAVANIWASRNSHWLGKKMEEARRGGGSQGGEEEEATHRERHQENGGGWTGTEVGDEGLRTIEEK
jgi:hypothetical protein